MTFSSTAEGCLTPTHLNVPKLGFAIVLQCFGARCLSRGATKRLPLEGKSPQQPTGERADLRLRPPVTSLLSLRPPAPPRPSRPETPPLDAMQEISSKKCFLGIFLAPIFSVLYDCVTEKTSGHVRKGLRSCESRGGFFCLSREDAKNGRNKIRF